MAIAIRHDADCGAHALRIWQSLMEFIEWGWWHEDFDELVLRKAELYCPNEPATETTDELPEWAYGMPEYDIDGDDDFII